MKNTKNSFILFYLAAALFDLASIISFVSGIQPMGTVWLCLGSTFLCLGSAASRKNEENDKKQTDKDKEEK